MGDGTERYPDYHPFVANQETTTGGTILGELRVSRFLRNDRYLSDLGERVGPDDEFAVHPPYGGG